MIDGSAAAPPLLLQLVVQQETKLTRIHFGCRHKISLEDEEEENGLIGGAYSVSRSVNPKPYFSTLDPQEVLERRPEATLSLLPCLTGADYVIFLTIL